MVGVGSSLLTGGTTQSIIHALQRMIHPGAGDPQPTILSISYGWGADDLNAVRGQATSPEFSHKQLDQAQPMNPAPALVCLYVSRHLHRARRV